MKKEHDELLQSLGITEEMVLNKEEFEDLERQGSTLQELSDTGIEQEKKSKEMEG